MMGPGWPNVDEEMLAAAAAKFEALAAKISGSIVPQQQGQLMKLSDVWEGAGALAATGEATTIIGGHEANAAHAAAVAGRPADTAPHASAESSAATSPRPQVRRAMEAR